MNPNTVSGRVGHSATVALTLRVAGREIRLSQVGPKTIVADEAVELEPCEAVLVVQVDDSIRERRVRLPGGMSADRRITPALDIE